MSEYAGLIRITPGKGLEIDGEPFPWYITPDTIVSAGRGEPTLVTVRILAKHVEVVDVPATERPLAKTDAQSESMPMSGVERKPPRSVAGGTL